jgi:hypothetical protein
MASFSCPGCGVEVTSWMDRCGNCELRLTGQLAAQLWRLDQHLAALFVQREQIVAALRSDDDLDVLASSPSPSPSPSPFASPFASPSPPAPGTETKRALLVLGAVCLITALSAGTALIWPALGVWGQTSVLLFVTAVLLGGAVGLQVRLPATAEAIAAVGVAAVGIDVLAGRRLVAPDLAGAGSRTYWIITALIAVAVLGGVGSIARRLYSPAAGAVAASYGVVVALVAPTSPDGAALVGLLGTALGAAIAGAAGLLSMHRHALRATAGAGSLVSILVGIFAAVEASPRRGLGLWCGLALAVGVPVVVTLAERRLREAGLVDAAALATLRRGSAIGGGLFGALLLLLARIVPLHRGALATAAAAMAVLLVAIVTREQPSTEAPALFVGAGAGLAGVVAQVALQTRAMSGSALGQAAVGLTFLAVVAVAIARTSSHPKVSAAGAALATATAIGAVAEAAGMDSLATASTASGAVASAVFGLAMFALTRAQRRRIVLPAAAVAAISGAAAAIAIYVNLAVREVSTPEAYVVVPAVVALLLGLLAMSRLPATSSWVLLPAIAFATLPTLALALGSDLTRQVSVLIVGAFLLAVGAQRRLACPLWVGAGEVLLVVLRVVGPEVTALPRWVTLGIVGASLLGLGATWERRVQDIRRITERLRPEIAALR